MDRRTFVTTLAAASAVAASSKPLFAAKGRQPLRVGLVGCGWFGNMDLDALRMSTPIEVVSLCDVNTQALTKTLQSVSAHQSLVPDTYHDYRKMLTAGKHDVVIVGTPDHWHALPAIAAMKAGADLLLEKPISVDVLEGEAIVAAARKYNKVVQVNLQKRSSQVTKEAKALYLDSGRIGKVGLVECFFYGGGNNKTIPATSPPAYLDYDMWAGPAPKVDFIAPIADKGWRRFMEYGNGHMGDMGVHIFDMVRMMMDLGWPNSISSTGGIYHLKNATGNRTDTQRSVFSYDDLEVSWEHRMWGDSPIPKRHWTDQWGARFVGTEGTLVVTSLGYEFKAKGKPSAEGKHLLSSTGDLHNVTFDNWVQAFDGISQSHTDNFVEARKKHQKPAADVEEGHISSACCILANMALELGRPLKYDPNTRSVINDKEATARLARPYRGDWPHPKSILG